jgi:anaerobic magnesium-protoporphyrin IX monomethyl ester cyclase
MESSDQKVLNLMNKNTTVQQNIKAAEITKKAGIGLGLNFIWGNIGDTEESLKNNVKLIQEYNSYDQLRTIRSVTPYPGCDLYYEAIKKGLLSGPEDFFNKFKNSDLLLVNFTDIPEKEFYRLLHEANKELILDHFSHTTKNMEQAHTLINDFYNLYFGKKAKFRGARHYHAA